MNRHVHTNENATRRRRPSETTATTPAVAPTAWRARITATGGIADSSERNHTGRNSSAGWPARPADRKSTRLNSSHANISYAVFCLKKKNVITSIYGH